MAAALYTGEDVTISIDLVDINFADLSDVIVGVIINDELESVFKKSSGTVYSDLIDPKKCSIRLTRSVTSTWGNGMLSMEITKKFTDSDYPSGKHVIYKANIVQFQNSLTKNS